MIDFPASPTLGQRFTDPNTGLTWVWDGTKWQGSASVAYLPLAGGTMTGPIVLAADPAAAMQPVTLQYFNARPMIGDNRIINGDMRIDQRNGGAAGTASGYTLDRWNYAANVAGLGTWQRATSVAMAANGFPYCLTFTSSSAHVSAAGDAVSFSQPIEADMVADFAWGASGARPVTLSFWVNVSVAGTYSGSIQNYGQGANTRTYPFSFALLTGWSKVVINIPGDTAGTWTMSGNGGGLWLNFDLGSGSTYRGPANAWATGNWNGVTGSASVVATNGATFNVTGLKLEVGNVATPYNRQSLAKSMMDCQRYFQINALILTASNQTATGSFQCAIPLPVQMRANPTLVVTSNVNSNISGFALGNYGNFGVYATASTTAAGTASINSIFSANAEL